MNTQPLILDMGHIQRRIRAVQLDIARYGVTLRLADFATLLMLTAAYVQELGWLAALPHAAFLPVYAFLAVYGGVRLQAGDTRTLYRCTGANALLAAIY